MICQDCKGNGYARGINTHSGEYDDACTTCMGQGFIEPEPQTLFERMSEAQRPAPDEVQALVERLEDGVHEIGMHEDNNTQLFDIESANEVMWSAAAMLRKLAGGQS